MTHEAKAGNSGASGEGGVVTASGSIRRGAHGECFAVGGVVSGSGQIIRKDGTVVDFKLVSDPLTELQAESLNKAEE